MLADKNVAAALVTHKSGAANVLSGVLGAHKRAIQIVSQADDKGWRTDGFQVVAVECGCNPGIVAQTRRPIADRKYLLEYRFGPLSFCGARGLNHFYRRRKYQAHRANTRQLHGRPKDEVRTHDPETRIPVAVWNAALPCLVHLEVAKPGAQATPTQHSGLDVELRIALTRVRPPKRR